MTRNTIVLHVALLIVVGMPRDGRGDEKPAADRRGLDGVRVGGFAQEVARTWTAADGLPSVDVATLAVGRDGRVVAGTDRGLARREGGRWVALAGVDGPVRALAVDG